MGIVVSRAKPLLLSFKIGILETISNINIGDEMTIRKRSILGSLLITGICAAMLSGCASTPTVPSDEEMWSKFVGTWVNAEYGYEMNRNKPFR